MKDKENKVLSDAKLNLILKNCKDIQSLEEIVSRLSFNNLEPTQRRRIVNKRYYLKCQSKKVEYDFMKNKFVKKSVKKSKEESVKDNDILNKARQLLLERGYKENDILF